VVSVATKEGKWYMYNAETGEPIYTGVQVLNLIDRPTLTKGQPTVIAPSTLGGVNYAPQSYDPTTNNVILSTVESKSILVEDASAQQVDQARARGDVDTDFHTLHSLVQRGGIHIAFVDFNIRKFRHTPPFL
jgi:hypothetical protein